MSLEGIKGTDKGHGVDVRRINLMKAVKNKKGTDLV